MSVLYIPCLVLITLIYLCAVKCIQYLLWTNPSPQSVTWEIGSSGVKSPCLIVFYQPVFTYFSDWSKHWICKKKRTFLFIPYAEIVFDKHNSEDTCIWKVNARFKKSKHMPFLGKLVHTFKISRTLSSGQSHYADCLGVLILVRGTRWSNAVHSLKALLKWRTILHATHPECVFTTHRSKLLIWPPLSTAGHTEKSYPRYRCVQY